MGEMCVWIPQAMVHFSQMAQPLHNPPLNFQYGIKTNSWVWHRQLLPHSPPPPPPPALSNVVDSRLCSSSTPLSIGADFTSHSIRSTPIPLFLWRPLHLLLSQRCGGQRGGGGGVCVGGGIMYFCGIYTYCKMCFLVEASAVLLERTTHTHTQTPCDAAVRLRHYFDDGCDIFSHRTGSTNTSGWLLKESSSRDWFTVTGYFSFWW